MKLFDRETKPPDPPAAAAQLCAEAGIRIVRLMRRALAETPSATLTPSRIRALAFLEDNPSACLSDVADHLIVGAPTASKLVEDLVTRGLLGRTADPSDRRRVTLRVTAAGRKALRTAARPGQERLSAVLAQLSAEEVERVRSGMETLLPLLIAAGPERTDG
jgi:DNA-binding MarR family transcriptional regulator